MHKNGNRNHKTETLRNELIKHVITFTELSKIVPIFLVIAA